MPETTKVKGGWVLLKYAEPTRIQRHILHPGVARARQKDILDRYAVAPASAERKASIHWDMGGMVLLEMTKKHAYFDLSRGRSIHVWADYVEDLRDALRGRPVYMMGGKQWYRLALWPDGLMYLSPADVQRILRRPPRIEDKSEAGS